MNIQGTIKKYLGSQVVDKIAKETQIPKGQVGGLLDKALPLFSEALKKNAQNGGEVQASLLEAIRNDHDGSVFKKLEDLVKNPKAQGGDKILNHIFGSNARDVKNTIAREVGITKKQSEKILEIIAPLTMGALGKEQSDNSFGPNDLLTIFGALSEKKDNDFFSDIFGIFHGSRS